MENVFDPSFFLVSFDLISFLIASQKIDRSLASAEFLEQQLELIHEMETRCKQQLPIIGTLGFAGGFLAGLVLRGWTFSKFINTPVIFVILFVGAFLFYFAMKRMSFTSLNKLLSKRYGEKKNSLRRTLELLKE